MSTTIDHRVVEMRFDNKQFEAGAKETMGTLTKLKNSLNFQNTGKVLDNLDQAVKGIKVDGISAGIEALEKRFSTLGIVGMRVIENITDGLMSKLSAAVSYVSDSIISGGIKRAMNIENAHFQLQALLKDETKVQAVMADAMEAVDGTAYAYDEAAKAASQFAASNIQAGDEMLGALKGITGVAAMTNSSFEDISRVFTTVAGNGRLMGDQLLQLSSRGLNAASTLADYFKEVKGQSKTTEADIRDMVSKGKISFKDFSDAMTWAFGDSAKRANETFNGALSNMKSALARIGAGFISPLVEQNGELVKLFNALRIKVNDVKTALVFDEQRSAISGLAEVTQMTDEELSNLFSTIKTNGKVSISDLDALTKKGANATDALTKYVNGVSNGSIRASYAITTALEELTNGTEASTDDIRRFVEEGKIDLATFTSAMETEFGNEKTLTKQFTDFFLDHVGKLVNAINSADLSKPMSLFYYTLESVKNVFKGLLSVLNPIRKAFSEVFLGFNIDDVIKIADTIETLTSKMKLSKKASKNLHDTFKGIFDIGKLLIDIFVKLLSAIVPVSKPVNDVADGFLGLTGAMGRGLSKFTSMIRSCSLLKRAFSGLSKGFSIVMDWISKLISLIKKFVKRVSEMEGVTKFIEALNKAFKKLGEKASPYVKDFIDWLGKMAKSLFDLDKINLDSILGKISDAFSKLASAIDNFSFKKVGDSFDDFGGKVKNLNDLLSSNKGLSTFLENAKNFGEDLVDALSFGKVTGRLDSVMQVFGKFFNWTKDTLSPAFENFSFGNVVGVAGGFSIIYMITKAFKAFKPIAQTGFKITKVLDAVTASIGAYQKDLKADAILKIAKAIGILAISITILSFADTERAWDAVWMLVLVGGLLIAAVNVFSKVKSKAKTIEDAAFMLSKAGNNFTKALKWKAIGTVFKDVGKSILMIGLTIIALGEMYKRDSESLKMGAAFVGGISLALVAIMAIGTLLGELGGKGMDKFSTLLKSITAMTIGIYIVVAAINKLFKIELPDDWGIKVGILAGIFGAMALLAIILGIAGKIAGGGSASGIGAFQEYLPGKVGKLAGAFKSQSNGGSLTAGPILALAAMLYVSVLSVEKLFKMQLPHDWTVKVKILVGIFAAMIILMLAMGKASKQAGGAIKAGGTILALTLFIAVIVGALMVLTIIPGDKLRNGVIALGSILGVLAGVLYSTGKITEKSKDVWKSILAMAVMVGVITIALSVLSAIPWQSLILSAVSLGIVLAALALDFYTLSKIKNVKMGPIITMIITVVAIAGSLYALSKFNWKSLAAAAGGLSLVLVALAGCFYIISKANVDLKAMAAILVGAGVIWLIAEGIAKLAKYDGDALLSSCLAISAVLLEVTVIALLCSALAPLIGAAMAGIAGLGLIIVELGILLAALGALNQIPGLQWIIEEGGELLETIGTAIGKFVGGLVGGLLEGIMSQLPQIALDLSQFMINLVPFLTLSKLVDKQTVDAVLSLTEIILMLTVAEVVNGLASLFGLSLPKMGLELSLFMIALTPFLSILDGVDESTAKAGGYIADMILKLTASQLIQGIGKFLGLNGSLSDFAEELKNFGPAIKEFAKEVEGIDAKSVEGAASAAGIMAEVAGKLQGHGGFIQKIMGDKSLSSFAKELEDFGPSIAAFAETVKDVKAESVEGAARAGEMMADMADKIPNSGGHLAKFTGDNNIADFGRDLIRFGKDIKDFAKEVSEVKVSAVNGASAIGDMMVDLAEKIPNSGGFFSAFTGDNNIADFGSDIEDFGWYMADFAETVSDINPNDLDNVVKSFENLVDLAYYVEGTSAKGLVDFSEALGDISSDAVNNFIDALSDGEEDVIDAIDSFLSVVIDAIDNGSSDVYDTAVDLGEDVSSGIGSGITIHEKQTTAKIAELCKQIVNIAESNLSIKKFKLYGEDAVKGIIEGLSGKKKDVVASAERVCDAVVGVFKSSFSKSLFTEIGKNAAAGLKDGLESKTGELSEVAVKAVNPIKEAVNAISDVINSTDFDASPTIQPVVDMSNVKQSVKDISALMNRTYNLSPVQNLALSTASTFSQNKKSASSNGDSLDPKENAENKYEFNQYNYSPKPLTRSEIYRQTSNQFSAFRRAVDSV